VRSQRHWIVGDEAALTPRSVPDPAFNFGVQAESLRAAQHFSPLMENTFALQETT